MESISLGDGLILTVVSMLLVFLVLAAIWLLIELVAKFVQSTEPLSGVIETPTKQKTVKADPLESNSDYQFVAEMMALVLASEGQTDRKFEVVKSERIK